MKIAMRKFRLFLCAGLLPLLFSCEKEIGNAPSNNDVSPVALDRVAAMLSELPLEPEHYREVHSAVVSSSGNGYDEEYMMSDLFASPGKGVGDTQTKAAAASKAYVRPLRELIREHVKASVATRSAGAGNSGSGASRSETPDAASSNASSSGAGSSDSGFGNDADAYLAALESSDVQIYWPYSENWDGESAPVFTFDPGDNSDVNIGYRIVEREDGSRAVETLEIDETFAEKNPVWVVNRNSDCGFTSLEIMRREHPEWDNGGGTLIIGGKRQASMSSASTGISALPYASGSFAGQSAGDNEASVSFTKTGGSALKTLVLKEFTMKRNYDSWFAGGSEFFIKAGSVNDFFASTEAELRLYTPQVTDFMIVVKRKQKGQPLPFNTVIVSDWSEQLDKVAFMITEDDGGTVEQWKCSAVVKIKSKSYGFDISLPFNSRDDIVWRGQLSRRYIDATSNLVGHFGDIDITFEVIEY